MNFNLGLRLLKIKSIIFNLSLVCFQSAIMPFSRKIGGNIIKVGNHELIVSNPEKGYMPCFIGFDLILRFNFFDLTKYK